jgi:PilZ domain
MLWKTMHMRTRVGARRSPRIDFQKPGFVITAPDAPWIECKIVDVSENGVCLDVGALVVPAIFAISFTSSGTVRRVCARVWRRGGLIGARFLTVKQLRTVGT